MRKVCKADELSVGINNSYTETQCYVLEQNSSFSAETVSRIDVCDYIKNMTLELMMIARSRNLNFLCCLLQLATTEAGLEERRSNLHSEH
jgi:hypothetical protein